jgi:hypothetical protein
VDLDPDPDVKDMIDNAVYLAAPAPGKIRVHVFCAGFASSAVITKSLTPYTSPTKAGAFIWPFAAGDLGSDEYVVTSGTHWANGGAAGGQIFALDIGIRGVDANSKKLSEVQVGKDGTKNAHYRIWGKPIRAVADGEVESWEDGMATNQKLGKLPEPTPKPVTGNHFWIRHGDVFVLYAHLQKDTLPAELKKKGAKVKAGQMLGLVGNSGNSSKPHTHIHCLRDSTSGPLRSLPFRNAWVLRTDNFDPPAVTDPWVRMTAHGVPKTSVAVWPASTWPTFKIPAVGISRGGTWANSYWISASRAEFEKKAQELFDQNGRRLIWVTTYLENGKRRWAGIARSGDWANSFWVSDSRAQFEQKAQDLFDQQGRRLVYVTTYREGNATRWIGIARSGNWANSFWISNSQAEFAKKAQELFDEKDRRLVHVTTFVENGQRRWVGIAQSGTWANTFWVSSSLASFSKKAQELFDNQGRRLIHVHSFVQGGVRRWVGIARSGDWANSFFFAADLDSFNRQAQDLFDEKGRRLMAVEYLVD